MVDDDLGDYIEIPDRLPVLPARDIVAFPSVMMSLYVGRKDSINAVDAALAEERLIFVLAQRDEATDDPGPDDLYDIGVIANVVKTIRMSEGGYKVLMQGIARGKIESIKKIKSHLVAEVDTVSCTPVKEKDKTVDGIVKGIRENLQMLVEGEYLPEEMLLVTEEIDEPGTLADVIVAHYKLEVAYAQSLLEEFDDKKRLQLTETIVKDHVNQLVISEGIQNRTRDELSKGQREYYLREQIRQIRKELGEGEDTPDDLAELLIALEKAKLPEHAHKEAMKQYGRLERIPQESSEYALLRTYLEWIADLPWSTTTKDRTSLRAAEKILNEDHHGLEKAKERILEFLSVRKLKKDSRGPILCFVGPPGVGKTSLGRSISRSLNRQFVRMSLGGVRDEAEIRGHRRTYVGALPGRIVQGLKQAGSRNPVFLLDELDKVGADFRGDPASALLEVLDPEQNKDFRDHYLGIPFDLSKIIFVATANTVDTIPDALLDRLEIIYISGYTTQEKLKIAQKHLIPRQREENGLEDVDVGISEQSVLFLIERYTREAGVRNLEREIGSLCRKLARQFAEKKRIPKSITPKMVEKYLGTTKYDPDPDDKQEMVGLARGLAWTVFGGEVMPVEASIATGKGSLTLTGQLGDVMQESAQAALFYARANAQRLGLDEKFHDVYDIHLHVPSGATPKDGPSAGITIATALVSALSNRKIRNDLAMTGEITLRGNVLPVGGIKEKALAALRYDITNVIIPADNVKDLDDIPKEQRNKITFMPVKHVQEVFDIAFRSAGTKTRSQKKVKSKRKTKPTIRA